MEWLFIIIAVVVVYFWWGSFAAREVAYVTAKQLCQQAQVLFLDDTVSVEKIRLQRSYKGTLGFYRRYRFEFTTDGEYRYRGYIDMLGRQILSRHMDTYTLH